MTPLSYLEDMLSEFSPLFKHNNFNSFETMIKGLINMPHRGTLTQIYLSTAPSQSYWCLPKFLSRGVWCADEVALSLVRQVQTASPMGVYVYDETHAKTDGRHQVGTHFFKNTRYQKRNKNQSKFHHGHEFGAIGWLAETPEGVRLFPLAARMMDPKSEDANSFAVLKHLCGLMPPGLIIFDRGFNRRKVFAEVLAQGHHLLCRAKSNAAFFHIPKRPKFPKKGRPRRYGSRVSLPHLKYRDLVVGKETFSVADKRVRTKMCAVDVRIVVIRKRPKNPSKPYQYFCVFTSDLQLPVETVIRHYKDRWQIETAFRDVKEHFGFDTYQLRNPKSLNRFVQLSFLAATLTQLAFRKRETQTPAEAENNEAPLDLETVLLTLNMHWYKPKYLTRGLMVAYYQHSLQQNYFSPSYAAQTNSKKNLKVVEDTT